jgi:hypothetical protein
MKTNFILPCVLLVAAFVSCSPGQKDTMEQQQKIKEELTKLNSLLRDSAFAVKVAAGQEAAYYTAQQQQVPVFDAHKDSTIKKSFKEEKIAINLAGFYALECGIGVLVQQKGKTPLYWLQQIVNKKLDSAEILLLNRFANATWKASQPFRSLSRIKKDNFIVANFLSEEETKKDFDQITAAATKLLDSLKNINDTSAAAQFKKISSIMQDKAFALQMAQHMEAAYYTALNKPVPAFVTAAEDTASVQKNIFEEKIATNIAGFYALECGLSYLATVQNKLPSVILQSILDSSINAADKQLLERFANATWKAGQPFRSNDRITREVFTPFYFLSAAEIEKDWVQITTMAQKLKAAL